MAEDNRADLEISEIEVETVVAGYEKARRAATTTNPKFFCSVKGSRSGDSAKPLRVELDGTHELLNAVLEGKKAGSTFWLRLDLDASNRSLARARLVIRTKLEGA